MPEFLVYIFRADSWVFFCKRFFFSPKKIRPSICWSLHQNTAPACSGCTRSRAEQSRAGLRGRGMMKPGLKIASSQDPPLIQHCKHFREPATGSSSSKPGPRVCVYTSVRHQCVLDALQSPLLFIHLHVINQCFHRRAAIQLKPYAAGWFHLHG